MAVHNWKPVVGILQIVQIARSLLRRFGHTVEAGYRKELGLGSFAAEKLARYFRRTGSLDSVASTKWPAADILEPAAAGMLERVVAGTDLDTGLSIRFVEEEHWFSVADTESLHLLLLLR